VAQLGARFHGMEEVVGSIPTRSTNLAHLLGANFVLRYKDERFLLKRNLAVVSLNLPAVLLGFRRSL
jgi:hypothetical protein